MTTIGKKIKQRRKALGMSVDELAAKIGKDRSTVYRYESGTIDSIPVAVLGPVAKALNVSPRYFLGWTEHDNICGYNCLNTSLYTTDKKIGEQTQQWYVQTGGHIWSDEEQQILLQCAQYILAANGAPDYDDKMELLRLFFEQLNK